MAQIETIQQYEITMDGPDSISPKDTSTLENLKKQEEAGEQGFAVFYKGDHKTGSELMKEAIDASSNQVRSLRNSYLRENAEALLNEMNKAVQSYMKHPTDENLSNLKSQAEKYKSFLDKY